MQKKTTWSETNEFISQLKNTYCRLKSSKISGVGVFAVRELPKGINPFGGIKLKRWINVKMSELENMDKQILKMVDDFFVIEKDNTVSVPSDGLNGMDISFFVNNSKNPNLKIKGDGIKEEIQFRALRNIKKGEELTVAYATYDHKYT